MRMTLQEVFKGALAEIASGFRRYPVWVALARESIGDQHRRTTLGPLWLVLNYFLFAGAFVVVFGHRNEIENFPAYVATGLYVWLLMSETINMAVPLFRREANYIKGTTLPLFVYVMRLAMQTVIRGAYSGAGWIVLMLFLVQPSLEQWLMAFAGLAVIVLALPAVITIFALLGAFFPDFEFITGNLVRVGMFLTPIFWIHGNDGGLRQMLYEYNPFTHFLAIVRQPIISGELPVMELVLCLGISAFAWVLAFFLLGALRKKVVFVV